MTSIELQEWETKYPPPVVEALTEITEHYQAQLTKAQSDFCMLNSLVMSLQNMVYELKQQYEAHDHHIYVPPPPSPTFSVQPPQQKSL